MADDLYILGVHDGHNSSVALLKNGRLIYAIQEERLTNIKNYIGFPEKSIKRVLHKFSLEPRDFEIVAIASKNLWLPEGHDRNYLISHFRDEFKHPYIYRIKRFYGRTSLYKRRMKITREKRKKKLVNMGFDPRRIIFVDHHLCHAAAAYFSSPWRDNVLVLTLDGSGDDMCSAVWIGNNGKLKKIAETQQDNSLGAIYSRSTFLMGMVPWEHEYKVMGLAPYAKNKYCEKTYNKFNRYLDLNPTNPLKFKRKIPESTFLIYRRWVRDFILDRFDNIACGLQKFTEELILKWVKVTMEKTHLKKLALGGGVFMNVKANKRIMEIPSVESIFVMPSCGDETNSIGAAYYAYSQYKEKHKEDTDIPPLGPIYFGDEIENAKVEALLDTKKFNYTKYDDIDRVVGELLAEGKVVARAKGRMEFGARALGNRSILSDPSRLDNLRKINMAIKKRDFWMPFAPSILYERRNDYIVNPKNIPAPYMILSFNSKSENVEKIIAAVHQADLTVRPQVLEKGWNPEYYRIIKIFEEHTGVGVVLNTSFNLHGFPIVNDAKQALWVMENSRLPYLALGNYLVER